MPAPDALLFTAPGCPHCPGVKAALQRLQQEGLIGTLEVVDIAQAGERAAGLGVRSVPWLRLGEYTLTGAQSPQALREWAHKASSDEGFADYIRELLADGRLGEAEEKLAQAPQRLSELLPLLTDQAAPMNVRLGLGALLEGLAGSAALKTVLPQLGELSTHADHRVRSDACHYLGLTGDSAALEWLRARLDDEHPEVREIAAEAVEALGD